MPTVTIYHNPLCTKSRQTLQLLRDRDIELKIVEYLKDPPTPQTLRRLVQMLGIPPCDLIRKKEPLYKTLNLAQKLDDPKAMIQALAQHPILIERPIVVAGKSAVVARPPERALTIL